MTISTILTLALGILLLLFGRRAFWIFVAVVCFIAGLTFGTMFMHGQPELVILLIAIDSGVIGAILAIMLEWLAILIGGFLAGGYLATSLAVSLGMTVGSGNWVIYIIGGIIGLIEGIAEATASILKLFAGWLSDRMGGRKWLAVAGYGLSALRACGEHINSRCGGRKP